MNEVTHSAIGRQAVVFSVDGLDYALDILAVREIRNWNGVTPLPNMPGYMRGVMNLRGVIVPVIDVRARFGLGLTEASSTHVVVIAMLGERLHGLLVDAVSDIVPVGPDAIAAVPDAFANGQASLLEGLLTVDERLVALLSPQRIVAGEAGSQAA